MSTYLGQDIFAVGMATLERFFRRKLHPADRDIYYRAVRSATKLKWEKVVEYACIKAKSLPKPTELREWMGLAEEYTPAEEHWGFKPGTIGGITPLELVDRVKRGDPLPIEDDCWASDVEKTVYLDQAYKNPPPEGLTPEGRLAWIRRYAEEAEEMLAKIRAEEERLSGDPARGDAPEGREEVT